MFRAAGSLCAFMTAVTVGLAVLAGPTPARADTTLEYSVKANYLVRFAAFVTWPPRAFADARAPVVICIAGRDPFGRSLDTAARDQTAHGRQLSVRRLRDAAAIGGCHILYVGRDGDAAIRTAAGQPIMVVTDHAAESGRGVAHFVIAAGRVRFHIDQQQAARSGLGISSRLLNLAVSVRAG